MTEPGPKHVLETAAQTGAALHTLQGCGGHGCGGGDGGRRQPEAQAACDENSPCFDITHLPELLLHVHFLGAGLGGDGVGGDGVGGDGVGGLGVGGGAERMRAFVSIVRRGNGSE